MTQLIRLSACLLSAVVLTACAPANPDGDTNTQSVPAENAAPASLPAEPLSLPVSLNTLMVALINNAADPIWVAAWRNPQTDQDWRELERMAVQLEVGGALLSVPGTGPEDQEWVADPAWQAWADKLQQAGIHAVSVVKARDLAGVASVGDEIVEICEGCHMQFKPALPTGGEFGELSPTAEELKPEDPHDS